MRRGTLRPVPAQTQRIRLRRGGPRIQSQLRPERGRVLEPRADDLPSLTELERADLELRGRDRRLIGLGAVAFLALAFFAIVAGGALGIALANLTDAIAAAK